MSKLGIIWDLNPVPKHILEEGRSKAAEVAYVK